MTGREWRSVMESFKNMKSVEKQIRAYLFQCKSRYQIKLALDWLKRRLDMFV